MLVLVMLDAHAWVRTLDLGGEPGEKFCLYGHAEGRACGVVQQGDHVSINQGPLCSLHVHVHLQSVLTPQILVCRLKKNCAAICDSAASYFGRDNVGLPGIALHFRGIAAGCSCHACTGLPCMRIP